MGKKDVSSGIYFRDNERFADVFNYLVFEGEQVIKSEELEELDTRLLLQMEVEDSDQGKVTNLKRRKRQIKKAKKLHSLQRTRDVAKRWCVKYDDRFTYVIMGIENQSAVSYVMPIRVMGYDLLGYASQINEIAITKRCKTSSEFLSEIGPHDKINPVITLVIYFGDKTWDGPKSLYDMFEPGSEDILKYVSNYKINILTPEQILERGGAVKLHSDFRQVVEFVAAKNDRNKLERILENNKNYSLRQDTLMLLKSLGLPVLAEEEEIGNMGKSKVKEDKTVNIWKAWTDNREEGRQEGRQEGVQEGISRGIMQSVDNVMKNVHMPLKEACDAIGITVADYNKAKESSLATKV
jgi:hypothetical protein